MRRARADQQWMAVFEKLEDPRRVGSVRHKLQDIVFCALCGTLAGAEAWVEVEEWAETHVDWLKKHQVELPNGVPSHDTFGRLFSLLDPKAFRSCFMEWARGIAEVLGFKHIAVDGKALRATRVGYNNPLTLVSAWAREAHMVLGQTKVEEHSNEIKAVPLLLQMLDISGCIVTIDAMGCQTEIAAQIVDKDGDYILAVKGNQPVTHDLVKDSFAGVPATQKKSRNISVHETHDENHGRTEHRIYTAMPAPPCPEFDDWRGIKTIIRVERTRQVANELPTTETHYYMSSIVRSAKILAEYIRGHWTIENELHWALDVQFNEDRNRIRKDNAPENAATIRRFALNLLKQDKSKKIGKKAKMKCVGWDVDYLDRILNLLISDPS